VNSDNWQKWFIAFVLLLGLIGAVTGIGQDDGGDTGGVCSGYTTESAFENCMERLDANQP
jgi:hypothetical protein